MIAVESVSGGVLRPASWRSTYVLKPDLKVLTQSVVDYGWLAPLVVNQRDNTIIDGHQRWLIAANEESVAKRDKGMVPVKWVDCDDIDAMVMHVRLNRGRGMVAAKPLSSLIRKVLRSHKYDEFDLRKILSMSKEEFNLLTDPGLLKSRKLDEHTYSKAWVPVEAPTGSKAVDITIERPPNADR